MKKIRVYVDGRKRGADGEFSVYIAVSDGRLGRSLIATGLTSPVKFDGREFPDEVRNAASKTARLNSVLAGVEDFCFHHAGMPLRELKSALRQELFGMEKKTKSLSDFIDDFAALKANDGTRKLYEATARKVRGFDASADFSSATSDWLARFHAHLMARGMRINGAAIELRNVRAVFNWAIDNGWAEKYPFRRFKIPQERTRKRSLTAEQLATLRDYPVESWQEEYRDMFMLSFYLIGINIGDLLLLPMLTDGRCVYHRRKTGRLYDIAVQPEAAAIISRYGGRKFLLSPLDRYEDYHDYLHHMNDALKKIGPSEIVPDKLGRRRKVEYSPLFPELTSYWARHTWATIAARLDIPKETIGKALGHSDFDSTTTDIYIDFDARKIDDANRRVIDFLNGIVGEF